ncbi:MAG: SAM-dependent methyltransferase, partial [Mycobacterium sp.]|nr:SAM-dependent methyltransferase [Mycobacterium sp.]
DAELVRERSAPLREDGVDIDMSSLVYAGERSHVVDYLRGKGWDANGVPRADLFARNGIAVPAAEDDDPLGEITFISGTLEA